MTKCDFCPHSINKKGVCVCLYSFCILSQATVKEILDTIVRISNGNK